MNSRVLIALSTTATSLILLLLVTPAECHADKPNIVVILADDLGIGDVGCYGDKRCLIETPNIDALAAIGLRFTDAHPSASVCGPTRRALMTGRYPWRFGGTRNSGPWAFVGPKPNTEDSTLGKLLKRSGYPTGYVGKWHLGTTKFPAGGRDFRVVELCPVVADVRDPVCEEGHPAGIDQPTATLDLCESDVLRYLVFAY